MIADHKNQLVATPNKLPQPLKPGRVVLEDALHLKRAHPLFCTKTPQPGEPVDLRGRLFGELSDAVKIKDIPVEDQLSVPLVLLLDVLHTANELLIKEEFPALEELPEGTLRVQRLGVRQMQIRNHNRLIQAPLLERLHCSSSCERGTSFL